MRVVNLVLGIRVSILALWRVPCWIQVLLAFVTEANHTYFLAVCGPVLRED